MSFLFVEKVKIATFDIDIGAVVNLDSTSYPNSKKQSKHRLRFVFSFFPIFFLRSFHIFVEVELLLA